MTGKWEGVAARAPKPLIEAFTTRATLLGKNRSEMIVLLMTAFVEGRVTIRDTPESNQLRKELYK